MIAQQPVSLTDVQKGLLGADAVIDETDRALGFGEFLLAYGLNDGGLGGRSKYRFLEERRVFRVDKVKPGRESLSSGLFSSNAVRCFC
jgi:hypothetical protein